MTTGLDIFTGNVCALPSKSLAPWLIVSYTKWQGCPTQMPSSAPQEKHKMNPPLSMKEN